MYKLTQSTRKNKKYMVVLPSGKKVHFGAKGYSDYTIHKDEKRKKAYIARHRPREAWDRSGMATAGFWSKHILWNKPSLNGSIEDTSDRFNITINRV